LFIINNFITFIMFWFVPRAYIFQMISKYKTHYYKYYIFFWAFIIISYYFNLI
jgi:hypothetical protein